MTAKSGARVFYCRLKGAVYTSLGSQTAASWSHKLQQYRACTTLRSSIPGGRPVSSNTSRAAMDKSNLARYTSVDSSNTQASRLSCRATGRRRISTRGTGKGTVHLNSLSIHAIIPRRFSLHRASNRTWMQLSQGTGPSAEPEEEGRTRKPFETLSTTDPERSRRVASVRPYLQVLSSAAFNRWFIAESNPSRQPCSEVRCVRLESQPLIAVVIVEKRRLVNGTMDL